MCSWEPIGSVARYARDMELLDGKREFADEVRVSLEKLDGSTRSAVALLTGMSVKELETYGGLPDDN